MKEDILLLYLHQNKKDQGGENPPHFIAKPMKNSKGDLDLINWECLIPGPANSPWKVDTIDLLFNFHQIIQQAHLMQNLIQLFHVNVFPSGKVCYLS